MCNPEARVPSPESCSWLDRAVRAAPRRGVAWVRMGRGGAGIKTACEAFPRGQDRARSVPAGCTLNGKIDDVVKANNTKPAACPAPPWPTLTRQTHARQPSSHTLHPFMRSILIPRPTPPRYGIRWRQLHPLPLHPRRRYGRVALPDIRVV